MYGLFPKTPPAQEPISLADAKLHLKVDAPDDDTYIADLISDARAYAENFTGLSLITQVWDLALDHFPALGVGGSSSSGGNAIGFGYAMQGWIRGYGRGAGQFFNNGIISLPRNPVQSVAFIKYLDLNGVQQTLDPSQYVVSLQRLVARIAPINTGFWPIAMRSLISPAIDVVSIEFTAGAGAATVISGAQSLPEATITVASTAGFPTFGTVNIGSGSSIQPIAYTGTTLTTFTGCSGGTGALPDGLPVVWNNAPRSVLRAMKLLMGHWYSNREGVITGVRAASVEVQKTIDDLLWQERILEAA